MRIVDGRVRTERLLDDAVTQPKLADSAVGTAEIIDDAVTHAKMADSAIGTGQIIDDAVTRPKLADSVIGSAEIIDGQVTDSKLDSLFQMQRLVAIDTPPAYVNFPTAYSDTPVVTTAPGPDLAYARVTDVVPGSFEWMSDAPGSASWLSWGHR